jgi:hypothetical protein
LRNDLRNDILEAVSSLRNYFVQVQATLESKTAAYNELEREVRESKEQMQRLRGIVRSRTRQDAPSLDPVRMETNGV